MSHTGVFIKSILQNASNLMAEVDYQALLAQMPHQSHPRRNLGQMQSKGQLIRLKKGFYVLTKAFIGKDYSPEIVANLLYGPSYLSLESALSYYQLIPERVETWTSVTTQKNKSFATPIGQFSYQHLSASLYPLEMRILKTIDDRNFLIASPEKALMDIFTLRFPHQKNVTLVNIEEALDDDLRIDMNQLKQIIKPFQLRQLMPFYKNRKWNKHLIQYLLGIL